MNDRAWGFVLLLGLWAAVPSGLAALAVAARYPLGAPSISAAGPAASAAPAAPAAPAGSPVDTTVILHDVFRPSRAPAPIAFDPLGQHPGEPPGEPLPAFALLGTVLGPARAAVIRGIPGQEAAQVLAEGEDVGGARVVRIEPTAVTLVWRGDTLRLALPKEGGR